MLLYRYWSTESEEGQGPLEGAEGQLADDVADLMRSSKDRTVTDIARSLASNAQRPALIWAVGSAGCRACSRPVEGGSSRDAAVGNDLKARLSEGIDSSRGR
jgi:hypothetical protein